MYGFSGQGTQDASIASAASYSVPIKILGANKIAIEFPEYNSLLGSNQASVWVMGSKTPTTSTFRRIEAQGVYSAASGLLPWESLESSGNAMTICDAALGYTYIMVALSTAATDGISCSVHTMQ